MCRDGRPVKRCRLKTSPFRLKKGILCHGVAELTLFCPIVAFSRGPAERGLVRGRCLGYVVLPVGEAI